MSLRGGGLPPKQSPVKLEIASPYQARKDMATPRV